MGRQRQIELRRDVAKLGVIPFPLDRNELPAAGRDGLLGNLGTNDGVDLADLGGAEAGVLQEDRGDARPIVGGQPRPVVLRSHLVVALAYSVDRVGPSIVGS